MSSFEKITLERGDAFNCWTVSTGGKTAPELTVDEALGLVAAMLFGVENHPIIGWMKTQEEWDDWHRRLDEMAESRIAEGEA